MKKQYKKPSMEVYDLKQRPSLLCGSGEPDYWGYNAPGIGLDGDKNKLA